MKVEVYGVGPIVNPVVGLDVFPPDTAPQDTTPRSIEARVAQIASIHRYKVIEASLPAFFIPGLTLPGVPASSHLIEVL